MRDRSYFAAPRCPGSLKEGYDSYCPAILRNVFKGRLVFHVLETDETSPGWSDIRVNAGAQSWYRMRLEKNKLKPDRHGEFLLKTSNSKEGSIRFHLDQAANEQLCMAIASQLFDFEVVPNGLIFFPDGKPAIIYRYMPIAATFKSFLALREMAGKGPGKKPPTFLAQAELLDKHGAASLVLRDWYFRLTLFMWLVANGDGHMKYSGVVKTQRGDFAPAPLFGICCGPVHQLTSELCLQGGLFEGDQQLPGFRENGHYTRTEFEAFGQRLQLPESRITKIINHYASLRQQTLLLINRSFMPEEANQIFRFNFSERMERIQ